jgi:hypothetical protein
MLTGELRNQIDGIWNDFWSGGRHHGRQGPVGQLQGPKGAASQVRSMWF